MRYTTVIDISELKQVYKNPNSRLVYLHLALKSGYHDADRDKCSVSIRNLAADVGLTMSAVRHALKQLQSNGLLTREKDTWVVKKWTIDTPPTPRKKPKEPGRETKDFQQQLDEQVREYQRKVMAAVRDMTREEIQTWVQELEEGRSTRHHGVNIPANQRNIQWLKSVINSK